MVQHALTADAVEAAVTNKVTGRVASRNVFKIKLDEKSESYKLY